MASHKRTHDELIEELSNQYAALKKSCAGYDEGDYWEAARLATVVYTLVNDGKSRGVSVLSQLGLRDKIAFVSHAVPKDPENILPWAPLCFTKVLNSDAQHVPRLDKGAPRPVKRLKFPDWWKEPVFENSTGKQLSRMNLVFALRSKDGGSHFDAELPLSPYLEMKTDGLGFMFHDGKGGPGKIVYNAHVATMRHIAYELEQSILPYI